MANGVLGFRHSILIHSRVIHCHWFLVFLSFALSLARGGKMIFVFEGDRCIRHRRLIGRLNAIYFNDIHCDAFLVATDSFEGRAIAHDAIVGHRKFAVVVIIIN